MTHRVDGAFRTRRAQSVGIFWYEPGFYAGVVSSAFTLGRFLSGYFWGHVSDSCGRKLVIIIGLLTTTTVSLTFGLSTKYWVALSSRFALGLMNGITPAVRTILHDICGTEHVVQAFAYIDGTKAVGIVFGSAIGGLLVQPAEHYPSLFAATGVFGSARYGTFNYLFKRKRKVEFGEEASNATPFASASTKGQQAPEPGLLGEGGILSTPKVKTILLLACVVQSLFTGFEEVYPLWALSIVSVGGLGWSTVEIGKVLLTTGLIMVPLQLFIFPSFVKALGAVRWMRMGCFLDTVAVLATPNATFVGFNSITLFVFSVASTTVVNCSFSAVCAKRSTSWFMISGFRQSSWAFRIRGQIHWYHLGKRYDHELVLDAIKPIARGGAPQELQLSLVKVTFVILGCAFDSPATTHPLYARQREPDATP
ncbi:unnamed protein product [Ectocarpus sp. CCAP 1310/34]|nr:unnamed protein product [Ectocarpus sp. CCAP 1310/34]